LFPGISFMPTGGVEVSKDNLGAWFDAGVVAVGMGSKLVSKAIMQHKEYDKLITLTKQAVEIINFVRK